MGLAGVGPGLGLDAGQLYFFDSFFCSFEFWEKKGDTKRGEKFFPFLLASLLLSDFFLLLSQLSFSLSLQLTDGVVPACQHSSDDSGPDLLRFRQLCPGVVVK